MERGKELKKEGIEMEHRIERYREEIFENIKHINEFGQEFCYAQ